MFFIDPPLEGFGAVELLDGKTGSGVRPSSPLHPAHTVAIGG